MTAVRFSFIRASPRILKLLCSFFDSKVPFIHVLCRCDPIVGIVDLYIVDEPFTLRSFPWHSPECTQVLLETIFSLLGGVAGLLGPSCGQPSVHEASREARFLLSCKGSREPQLALADGRLDTFTFGHLKHRSV